MTIRKKSPLLFDDKTLERDFAEAARFAARELSRPSERKILPRVDADAFNARIEIDAPANGSDLSQLRCEAELFLRTLTARLISPGFGAMITASPSPFSVLADVLAASFNQHVARGDVTEFAARLEERVIQWIAQFVDYPAASGVFTSGGSIALLVSLAAARRRILGPDVRTKGTAGFGRVVAYTSEAAHFSVDRAIDLLGIGTDRLRKIACDASGRISIDQLEGRINEDKKAGEKPLAIVAQGGSVSIGAVDRLDALADVAERHGIWLHVDAAYGGPAAATDAARPLFEGMARADSVSLDPHKWLYASYESGVVLTRHAEALVDAFAPAAASYIKPDIETDAPDYLARGLEMSRGFRALKVWALFKGHGTRLLRQTISQDIALARHFGDLIDGHREFERLSEIPLSIVVFRYRPADVQDADASYIDALNARLPAALREGGRIYMGAISVCGRMGLRYCLINHRMCDEDVDGILSIVARCGRQIHMQRADWWKTVAIRLS